MGELGWTILLLIGLFICVSLIFGGIGVCFTAAAFIVKYVVFMLAVGTGMIGGTICVILLLAD